MKALSTYNQLRLFYVAVCASAIIIGLVGTGIGQEAKTTEQKVTVQYDAETGRPLYGAVGTKPYHRAPGKKKLVAGQGTVTLNTSTANGSQDISFIGDSTYHVFVWSTSPTNANRYVGYPTSGKSFTIKCVTDTTDTATVNYVAEGQ